MLTHKINQIKVQLLLIIAIPTLILVSLQAVPFAQSHATFAQYETVPAASLMVDGGHTIDVG